MIYDLQRSVICDCFLYRLVICDRSSLNCDLHSILINLSSTMEVRSVIGDLSEFKLSKYTLISIL